MKLDKCIGRTCTTFRPGCRTISGSSIGGAGSSSSREKGNNPNEGRWSKFEHFNFLKALKLHGRDWKKVAKTVCTRTSTQCRSHAQKFIVSLEKQGKNLEFILENDFFNSLGDDALNMDDGS